jgi:plasmid stabilization system protein ParE
MGFDLQISEETEDDIESAYLWYEIQRTSLGFDFETKLEGGFLKIRENPLAFQIRYDKIRVHFIDRFPYGIHYYVEEHIVKVVAVFHTSRDPEKWYERFR